MDFSMENHWYEFYFILENPWWSRPTQSMICVPLLVGRFQVNILIIVQYKYVKSCYKDFIF